MGAEGELQEVASSGKAVVRIKESEARRGVASMEKDTPSRSGSVKQIGGTKDKTGLERQIREMNEKLLEMRKLLHNRSMLQA